MLEIKKKDDWAYSLIVGGKKPKKHKINPHHLIVKEYYEELEENMNNLRNGLSNTKNENYIDDIFCFCFDDSKRSSSPIGDCITKS